MHILNHAAVVAIALNFSALAFAQDQQSSPITTKAGFYLRIDGNSVHTDTNGVGNQTQQFTTALARIAVSGDVSPTVSYLVRFDVKNQFLYMPTSNGSDGVTGALERAYVQHQLTPWLMARYGRQPMLAESLEGDYSSLDLYVYSKQYELINFIEAPTTTGVNLSASFGPHTLQLQAFDGTQEQHPATPDANVGNQKPGDLIWALGYRSKLFGGLVKPILTYDQYHRVRNGHDADLDDAVIYVATGVGAQFSALNFDLDVEQDSFTKPAFTSHSYDSSNKWSAVANKKDVWTTDVVQLAYNVRSPNLRPFIKGSYDREDNGSAILNYKRGGVGVEYRPFNNTFRYHFVVISKDEQAAPKAGASGVETKTLQYVLGLAAKG